MRARGRWYLVAALLLGSCKTKEEAAPAPTAPWAAPRPAGSVSEDPARAPLLTRYRVLPSSTVRARVPGKEAEPSGVFRVVKGALEVDVRELENTRGVVEIDLGSILMRGDDANAERDYTQRARNWLNLGDARPDAELERLRMARLTVQKVHGLSAPAAHLGQKLAPDTANPGSGERRRVSLSALVRLELNDRRVTREANLVAEFDYSAPATPGALPTRIRVATTRFVEVPLVEHDVRPRDSRGRLVSSDLELLGKLVGNTARVEAELVLEP